MNNKCTKIGVLFLLFLLFSPTIWAKKEKKSESVTPSFVFSKDEFNYFFVEAIRQKNAGNIPQSIDLFIKAYDINPRSAIVSFELGKLFLLQNNPDMGFSYIKNAAELDSTNFFYQESLGQLYIAKNKTAEAIAVYQNIARLFPDKDEILYDLGRLYAQQKEYKKAIAAYDKFEKRIGVNKSLSYEKVQLYVQMKNYKQAHREVDNLIERFPSDHTLWIMKGDLEMETSDLDDAFEDYQKALALAPESGYVFISLTGYYEKTNQMDEAEKCLFKIFEAKDITFSDKSRFLENILHYYENKPDGTDKINKVYLSIVDSEPTEYQAHLNYATFLISQKKGQEAKEHLRTAVYLKPECVDCWLTLFDLEYKKDSLDAAYSILEEAIKAMPDEPLFYYYSGLIASTKEKSEQAISFLEQTLQKTNFQDKRYSEMNKVTCVLLSDLYYKKNEKDKAIQMCKKALTITPDDVYLLNNCAYYMAITGGDLALAEQMSAKTIEKEPLNTSFLDTYAYILFKQKKYNLALFYVERAVEYVAEDESRSEVYEHYGDILFFSNQKEKALEMWKKSVEFGQKSETINRKIQEQQYVE